MKMHPMVLRGISYQPYGPSGSTVDDEPSRSASVSRDDHFMLRERLTVELATGATHQVFEREEMISTLDLMVYLRGDAKKEKLSG